MTFADICDAKYSGKRMTIEGYVGLPSVMLCTDSCKLSLFQSLGGAVELAVSMTVGDSVNEMSKLPDDYKSKDLRIRTADGSIVGEREKVRVSGERAGNGGDECVLIVDLIERP